MREEMTRLLDYLYRTLAAEERIDRNLERLIEAAEEEVHEIKMLRARLAELETKQLPAKALELCKQLLDTKPDIG